MTPPNPPPPPPTNPPPGPKTPPPPPGPPRHAEQLYSVAEVAELWHVSADTVYRLIADRQLATVQLGTGRAKTRIAESALAAYVKARTTPARRRAA